VNVGKIVWLYLSAATYVGAASPTFWIEPEMISFRFPVCLGGSDVVAYVVSVVVAEVVTSTAGVITSGTAYFSVEWK